MPIGSITAPDRIWAPTSEPFSTTTTVASGAICLRRIAAASPAGPAPTTTTSNSIASRAGNSGADESSSSMLAAFGRFGLRARHTSREQATTAIFCTRHEPGVSFELRPDPAYAPHRLAEDHP